MDNVEDLKDGKGWIKRKEEFEGKIKLNLFWSGWLKGLADRLIGSFRSVREED